MYRTPKGWREPNAFVGFLGDARGYLWSEVKRGYGLVKVMRGFAAASLRHLLVRLHLRRRDF